mmetsp:Transcript_8450/g.52850  ORF Transcript_8450/g.52850 Transcript_8450/m.52850 type:complete len:115 (-) Transcript_8450:1602-1946(-)
MPCPANIYKSPMQHSSQVPVHVKKENSYLDGIHVTQLFSTWCKARCIVWMSQHTPVSFIQPYPTILEAENQDPGVAFNQRVTGRMGHRSNEQDIIALVKKIKLLSRRGHTHALD